MITKAYIFKLLNRIVSLENTPPGSADWGGIGGTLSAQTDLNTALNGKEPTEANKHLSTNDYTTVEQSKLSGIAAGATVGANWNTNLSNIPADFPPATHNHAGVYEPANANIQSHVGSAHAPANAQKNSDILQAEIEAKLTGEISSHSHAGGGAGDTIVLKVGDTPNSTTTLADCAGLTFAATASKTYLIEVFLIWNASAATVGIKASLSASAGVTILAGHFITDAVAGTPDSSSFNASNVVTTTSASAFTTSNMGRISAVLVNAGASNTITVRFAAETTGTITAKGGSVLKYRLLN